MSDNIKIIADKVEIDDIADAVREKTGKTEKMSLGEIARNVRGMSEAGTALDLDEEITTQEGLIASQDTIIADIVSALDGKAAGGGITPPEYSMVSTIINYDTVHTVNMSYLGLNEDGILVEKMESLTGIGNITIQSSNCSLIDCYINSMFLDPSVSVNWEYDDNYDGYQDAFEHHNIITGDSRWLVLYPGGIFSIIIQ